MSDCLEATNSKVAENNTSSPAFNTETIDCGGQTLAISSKAKTKTPLVNVPTFNDLDN